MIPEMDERGRIILTAFQEALLKDLVSLIITYDVSFAQLESLLRLVPALPISHIHSTLGEVLSLQKREPSCLNPAEHRVLQPYLMDLALVKVLASEKETQPTPGELQHCQCFDPLSDLLEDSPKHNSEPSESTLDASDTRCLYERAHHKIAREGELARLGIAHFVQTSRLPSKETDNTANGSTGEESHQ